MKLAIYLENPRPHKAPSLFSVNHRIAEVVRDVWRPPRPTPVPKAESIRAGFFGLSAAGFWIFSKMEIPKPLWVTCLFCFIGQHYWQQRLIRTSISLLTKSDSQADLRTEIKQGSIFVSWGHNLSSIFTTQPSRDWRAVIRLCVIALSNWPHVHHHAWHITRFCIHTSTSV